VLLVLSACSTSEIQSMNYRQSAAAGQLARKPHKAKEPGIVPGSGKIII
jgi:hypothetical protein